MPAIPGAAREHSAAWRLILAEDVTADHLGEDRIRAMAQRQGLRLLKTRRCNTQECASVYTLVTRKRWITFGTFPEFERLDGVEAFLNEREPLNPPAEHHAE